jgi:predicted amidohydrolase
VSEQTVKIAALQMLVTPDVAGNEGRILAGLERAAAEGADFLLTPEGSLSGYHNAFDGAEVEAAVGRVTAAARAAHVGLALGTCYKERDGEAEVCYNQVRIYAPEGDYLGHHAKILRCSRLAHPGTGEMQQFAEGALRTFDWRDLRFGALICNDLWATPGFTTMPNPYLAWRLKQMGAQFLLHAINSGRDLRHRLWHEACSAMWAKAVQLPILQVNAAPADGLPLNAPSGLLGPDGTRLLTVPDSSEEYFACDVEPAERENAR